ncbi:MAG TPA: glycosyltransferase family 39 protein [Prolixibacteraceae bacterium]|nr:glycosyltransferase family 39 protein [Prolixibacteraceae bacterium]
MLVLAGTVIAAYVAGLFVDVTRDASKYAAIAREIARTGDFIHLQVEGDPYLQKPPLMFWLSALSYLIFGVNNFAFKLPLLLFSFFGIYSTYRLGKTLFGRETGMVAAILLSSTVISWLYNMDIHTDTLMQSLVVFSLWQLADFLQKGRWVNLFMGFTGVGMAMLVKGPVGAVIPAFAVAGSLVFTGRFRKLLNPRWYIGIVLALICTLPALIGLFNQFGWEGVRFFLWSNNLGRLAGDYSASDRNVFYYLYNLLLFFLPWSLFLLVSLSLDFKRLFRRKFRAADWFLFSGIWFYFILISLSGSKLPHYLYATIPLFSLMTARYLVLALSGKHIRFYLFLRNIQGIVLVLFLALIAVLVFSLYPPGHLWQWAFLLLLTIIAGLFLFSGKYPPVKLFFPSLALFALVTFYLNQQVAPQIFGDQASVKAAGQFNLKAGVEEQMYNYNYDSHELYFYCRDDVSRVKNDVHLWELMKSPGNWVLTTREVVDRMPSGMFPEPVKTPLSHVWINKLSFKYLHPATRASARDTLILLRSAGSGPK